jgi:hypothetical protein
MMETRAEVATILEDERKVLNGMRESDLEKHLQYALGALGCGEMITPQQVGVICPYANMSLL